jgi:hypothetical protein
MSGFAYSAQTNSCPVPKITQFGLAALKTNLTGATWLHGDRETVEKLLKDFDRRQWRTVDYQVIAATAIPNVHHSSLAVETQQFQIQKLVIAKCRWRLKSQL